MPGSHALDSFPPNGPPLDRHAFRRVTLPVALLVALLLAALLATVIVVANYQTAVAIGEQAKLASGAIDVRGQHIEKSALDYGAWNDAVDHLVDALDPAWADENIGEAAFANLGFDMTLVLAPDGTATYAMIDGERREVDPAAILSGGFDELVARRRAGAFDGSTSGLVLAGGQPAVAAVAPIRRMEGSAGSPQSQHLLVFVDRLDETLLAEIAHIYLLPDLSIRRLDDAAVAGVPLRLVDGSLGGRLVWNGSRPGDTLLRTALPVWAVLAAGFALLTAAILRQAAAASRLIGQSEARSLIDPLTQLPNRRQLIARLDAAVLALDGGGAGFAVLYLDLDGFKAVNDLHGHAAGDEVLRQAAGRLADAAGRGSLLARLGGDEFAGILAGCEDPREARRVGERMIAAVRRPIALPDGPDLSIGATIGIAFAPTDGTDPLTLLRKADGALYVGKRGGKGLVQIHIALAEAKAG